MQMWNLLSFMWGPQCQAKWIEPLHILWHLFFILQLVYFSNQWTNSSFRQALLSTKFAIMWCHHAKIRKRMRSFSLLWLFFQRSPLHSCAVADWLYILSSIEDRDKLIIFTISIILCYHLGDEWNGSLSGMIVNKLYIKNQKIIIICL